MTRRSLGTSWKEYFAPAMSGRTPGSVDISNWTISDGFGLRHTFASGTILETGQAMIVFGGGTPVGPFGNALFTTANTGSLGLNNGGDTVTLANDSAVTVDESIYGGGGTAYGNTALRAMVRVREFV